MSVCVRACVRVLHAFLLSFVFTFTSNCMKFTYKHKLHMLAVVQAHVVYFYTYALQLYDNFLSVLCSLLAQLTRSKRNERENPKISLASTCKTVLCGNGNGMWNAVSIHCYCSRRHSCCR